MSKLKDSRKQKEHEQKLVAWVNEQFTRAKNDRWKVERQWYMNLAFYYGQQNVQFKGGVGKDRSIQLWVPPAPYWRARPVINRIRPLLRTEMAKLTAQEPNAYVVPASSDDRDMFAANAAEQIWDSIYRWKKVHSKLRRSVFWTSITGNGFLKSYWDETATDPETGMQGDICFDPVTPMHIFVPDLREEEIEDQPWVMHAQLKNADILSNMYGKDIKFEKASAGSSLETSFLNVMGIQQWEKNKNVLVLECWIRPGICQEFPEGGLLTVAGNQIVYEGPWPYEHNLYPIAHIGHVPTGKFYRESVIGDLIPLQKEYNRTRGQVIEAKNRMAKPQLAAEIGSLDPTKITSEPGQVIQYRPGFQPPQPIPLQGLPSYVTEEMERIKDDMNEISGQHEISRGVAPAGVTAATAITYLQEQDETKLGYTHSSIEEAMEKIGHITLSYVKQFWDTARDIKVTGQDGSFDVLAFQGSDLRGNTDIRMEAGSSLPTSKAAKQAFIMDLMKMGFIDPQKGLEVMEIGGINKIYEQMQADVRQAQRENLRMAQANMQIIQMDAQAQMQDAIQSGQAMQVPDPMTGQPAGPPIQIDPNTGQPAIDPNTGQPQTFSPTLLVPVNTWDDHRIHIERHNHYRKGQAFEQLPQEAKDLFEQHVNQHIAAIVTGAMGALPPDMIDPQAMQNAQDPAAYQQSVQQNSPSVPEAKL